MRQQEGLQGASLRYFSAGRTARLLHISQATLRTYELEGLIRPEYIRGQKCFSHEQVNWISCINHLIHDQGISIPGLKRLLKLAPCWEIADCPEETRCSCKASSFTIQYLEKGAGVPQCMAHTQKTCKSEEDYHFDQAIH
ncbi:MAG: MerR family transcriptional regulator [Thermodesulfobacteria bacterium]|nr:MerR family transcriptional regulator [Thermodesulfobacteriota bacterium]